MRRSVDSASWPRDGTCGVRRLSRTDGGGAARPVAPSERPAPRGVLSLETLDALRVTARGEIQQHQLFPVHLAGAAARAAEQETDQPLVAEDGDRADRVTGRDLIGVLDVDAAV